MSKKENTVVQQQEFRALDQCIKAIKPLGAGEAERIITYLKMRFVDHKDFS